MMALPATHGRPWPRSRDRRTPQRRTRRRTRAAPDLVFLLTSIPSLPRSALSRLTTAMIDRMDRMDGDPDVELNGDELDQTGSHEEDTPYFGFGAGDGYPGDPDDAEDTHDQEAVDDA